MGIIITVANQKGGVGKTTTAINMSAALAEKGKKILLVDIDSQGNTTSGLGIEKNELECTTYELMLGEKDTESSLIHTEFKNLDILPSNVDMAAAEIELLDEDDREFKLRHILRPLKKDYDFIIVDCPPSLNILTVNAMTAADSVLVPIQCEYYALEGLSQLLYTIELVKERLNPELKIEGILFTMYDSRVRLSGQVVQNVKANLKEKIFKTVIPRNVRLAEAPSHGKPVSLYARFSSGTRAYRNLAKELLNLHANDVEEKEEEEVAAKDVYTDDILGLEENTGDAAETSENEKEANNKDEKDTGEKEESKETNGVIQKEGEADGEESTEKDAASEEETNSEDKAEDKIEKSENDNLEEEMESVTEPEEVKDSESEEKTDTEEQKESENGIKEEQRPKSPENEEKEPEKSTNLNEEKAKKEFDNKKEQAQKSSSKPKGKKNKK